MRRNYGRPEFHGQGPWQYGPYEWRCEVEACRCMESLPSFFSLEKHFQKLHHEKRIEYMCAFRGPTCFREAKHDVARDHCRSPAGPRIAPAQTSGDGDVPLETEGRSRMKNQDEADL